jgi:hypothetical protein
LQHISDSSLDAFKSKIKMIAPISQTFSSRVYKVAWGPCLEPTWAQLANPTNEPLFVRKGERIAELHLGGEWITEGVDLNPSVEEQAEEVFKNKEAQRGTQGCQERERRPEHSLKRDGNCEDGQRRPRREQRSSASKEAESRTFMRLGGRNPGRNDLADNQGRVQKATAGTGKLTTLTTTLITLTT